MSENLIPIKTLSPFTKFCCTIGALPSSYLLSLTYEEQLLWLCHYIKDTVIPAINNNAEAVEELQNLYIELKNYVDNYFDNLDVQEEINNKLEEMLEDGTLAQIVADYIGKTFTIFDSVNEMKNSISLQIGSRAKTLGFYEIGDFGDAEYEIIESAVPDDKSIFELKNGLFAKLIPKSTINPQMFGAHGYKIENYFDYNETKEDSSEFLQFTTTYALENNIKNIEFLGLAYNCSGNNPCGIPIKQTDTAVSLNFDGQNSAFFWDNLGNDSYCFFFIGYLSRSTIKNMQINSISLNNKGSIFSSHFGIDNQTHWNSFNIFENININYAQKGNINKVINFEIDGINSHDDLTQFINISARDYLNFVYCNNSESVKNSFENCGTNMTSEGVVDFMYDSVCVPLNINNHHFTFSENNCIIYKNTLEQIIVSNIYITKSRMELRKENFMYCDMKSGQLHIDNLYKYGGGVWDNSTTGKLGYRASLYLLNMQNAIGNFELETYTSVTQSNVIIENSSFRTETIISSVPLFSFKDYESYNAVRIANRFTHNIYIKNAIPQISKFFTNFEINSQYYKYHEDYQLVPGNGYIYLPNCNFVIEELDLETNAPSNVTYRVMIVNNGGSYAYTKSGSFTNGKANINASQKLVCPANSHYKNLIVRLYNGETDVTSQYKTIVHTKYRNTFFEDEFQLENSNWINK